MNATTGNIQKRVAQLVKEIPSRGLERYPSVLKNAADLPEELRTSSLGTLVANQAIRTIISFPAQIQRGWFYVPKQALLFTDRGVIHSLSSLWPNQEPQVNTLDGSSLLYMRVTLSLLYGNLEIAAQGVDSPAKITVEFNTVAWEMLSRPLHRLLQGNEGTPGAAGDRPANSPQAQQTLEKLSFKFLNGMYNHALLPGEALQEMVFQPGVSRSWNLWPFQFHRPFTADSVVSLTSNFVAVLQEELGVWYGWVLTHIPRDRIAGMSRQPRGLYDELVIQLAQAGRPEEYRIPLAREAVEAWKERWIRQGGTWQDSPEMEQAGPR